MPDHHENPEEFDFETQALFAKADNSAYQIVSKREFPQRYLDLQTKLGYTLKATAEEAQAVLATYSDNLKADHAAREKRDVALVENKLKSNDALYQKHVTQFAENAYTPEEWKQLYGTLPRVAVKDPIIVKEPVVTEEKTTTIAKA